MRPSRIASAQAEWSPLYPSRQTTRTAPLAETGLCGITFAGAIEAVRNLQGQSQSTQSRTSIRQFQIRSHPSRRRAETRARRLKGTEAYPIQTSERLEEHSAS